MADNLRNAAPSRPGRFRTTAWIISGIILTLALVLAGSCRNRSLHDAALAHWEGQLSSVADVTKYAIMRWVEDRLSEMREFAALLADHPEIFEKASGPAASGRRSLALEGLQPYLQLIKKQNDYSAVWVTDARGEVLLSWDPGSPPEAAVRQLALGTIAHNSWQILGPLPDSRGTPTLIFSFPIQPAGAGSSTPGRECLGTVLLTVDPSKFLYPLVSVDSMLTRTGEQMLVARLEGQFVILSPLRHTPMRALSIRMPWDKAPEIGRLAVERESMFGEFTDFRGVPVIAVTRHVSGTVGLIRQIDQSEAYMVYRRQVRTEGLLALSILAMIAFAFIAFGRAQRASRLRQLAASEARLAGIIKAAMDAIVAFDSDLRITLFNAAAERMFQCRSDEAVGQPLVGFLPERVRDAFLDKVREFSRSSETARAFPDSDALLGLRRDGGEFPLEAAISKLEVGGEGTFLAIIRDITERQRSAELLRNTEEKYRRLFEESREVVFISSADKFLDINPAGVELFGYDSKEELLKVDIAQNLYVNPPDRAELLRNHETRGFVKDYEINAKRKDGQKLIVLETSNAVRDECGKVVAHRGILRDITERKSLERQLLQAQKMEAIGQLAGGIAHDFNNILTAILGYSELLLVQCTPEFPNRRDIEEIAKAATRAAALTRQLLAFSRRQVMQPRVLDLNGLVTDMNKMLRRLITESIELRTELDPELGRVKADPAQIEQVILNLVVNARDAMPKGGVLTIQTGNANLTEELSAQPLNVPAGRYVMISVNDTGSGIDPEVQGRMFEPFFTTKEVGKGTGLGLSTVYGIVKQSGGYITAQSEIGRGSAFRVYLPGSTAWTLETLSTQESSQSYEGTETILLVEDEVSVRSLTRDILLRHKYRVLEATNGEEAVALGLGTNDPIHLMITDMVMPVMGGRELARRLVAVHPETRVLYVSGYGDSAAEKDGAVRPGKTFLPKPFTPLDLVRLVRGLLDEGKTLQQLESRS